VTKFLNDKIFLVDGIGALLSAAMIGLVLPRFEIGLPDRLLYALAIVALSFFAYSMSCFFLKKNSPGWLRVIVIANSVYSLITAVVVVAHFAELHPLGLIYFLGELLIIFILVVVEIKILKRWQANDRLSR